MFLWRGTASESAVDTLNGDFEASYVEKLDLGNTDSKFPSQEHSSIPCHRVVDSAWCIFLRMDLFAMMQFDHRDALCHKVALTTREIVWDWDALSAPLAHATFSPWDQSNSFKSRVNHCNMCASLGSCACSLSAYILIRLCFILGYEGKCKLKVSVFVSAAFRENISTSDLGFWIIRFRQRAERALRALAKGARVMM